MNRASELLFSFLINASWQIIVLALIAIICARLLKNVPARYQHALWVATLVLSIGLPCLSLFGTNGELGGNRLAPVQVEGRDLKQTGANSLNLPNVAIFTSDDSQSFKHLWQSRRQQISSGPILPGVFAFAYVCFLIYRGSRLWLCWRRTQSLKRSAYEREIPQQMITIARRCASALGLSVTRLVCSPLASAPGVVGGQKPAIILPESFFTDELPEETVCSILGHEMSHVARRDYQLNIAYELLLLPISFHPIARFIKHQIDRTRELACDEMVTETLLAPVAHARSLIRIAGALIPPADQALSLGIFNANILEERIMKLTRKPRALGSRAGRLLTLSAIALLCFSCLAISTFSVELRTGRERLAGSQNSGNGAAAQSGRDSIFGSQAQLTQERNKSLNSNSAPVAGEQIKSGETQEAQQRAQSACDAGRNGTTEAIPQLISMLGDDRKTELVRCWTGGRWNPALSSFKHPSPGEQAAIALASMGTPAFGPLLESLGSSNAVVRRNAAWAIGELTNMRTSERTEAVVPLISLLGDSDSWVRMAAARSLGELRDERSGERLVAALLDSSQGVRQISAWALGEMKDQRAVEALSNLVVSDTQAEVRLAAAEALGEIASSRAVSALTQALSDSDPLVRAKARWALSEINDDEG